MTQPLAAEAYVFPASFAQRRLWFIEQVEDSAGAYNVSFALRFQGTVDVGSLVDAFEYLEGRHEILRTTFAMEDGEPSQVVHPPRPFALRIEPLAGDPAQALREEAGRPFDLRTGPLVRAVLFQSAPDQQVLVITMHHAIVDAWSIEIMVRELAAAYSAAVAGRPPALDPLPIQYADYTVWQIDALSGPELARKLEYWRHRLTGPLPVLELPTDRARPLAQTYRGGRVSVPIDAGIAEPIRRLARESNATLFMTLLATYQVFLMRHSGQTDLITGTPITGRTQAETQGLIGFFLNMLAIRSDLSGNPTFREMLSRVRQTVLDAYDDQDVPFERLVEALQLPRDWSRHPLFQTAFVLHQPEPPLPVFPGLVTERLAMPPANTARFDLLLSIADLGGALRADFEFNTDLFDRDTVERMATRYLALLGAIGADAEQAIGSLEILGEPERRLIESWAGTTTAYPRDQSVPELFEARARLTPDAIAVTCSGTSLTYRELDARANQLAHHLHQRGVTAGMPVGICIERSIEMVVGLLGILKTGCAYVPLDPNYPAARLALMIEDAEVRIVVTRDKLSGLLTGVERHSVVLLDRELPAIAAGPSTPPPRAVGAMDAAYVMFTSGSSGRPKGVIVPHRGIVRLVVGTDLLPPDAFARVLCYSPVSFDASTLELWGALLNGGTALIFPAHAPSLAELGQFLERERVGMAFLTAALFNQMVDAEPACFARLDYLVTGGDVASPAAMAKLTARFPKLRLINAYGPTENTTITCCHRVTTLEPGRAVPIGRPIANTSVYLLDGAGSPAPVGVPAELYTGGDGLALGYYNRPEATAERFSQHPSVGGGARLYRTGDRARWLPDGAIDFLGRVDDQVKIRGYRIEPEEIRTVLEAHPAVAEAAAVVRRSPTGDPALVGYYVTRPGLDVPEEELKQALQRQLPPFMVPAVLIRLPALPLTPVGKLDREALLATAATATGSALPAVPRSTVEAALAALWESLLGRAVGTSDDFFAMGGHSLLAARMVDELERSTGLKLPLSALFKGARLGEVAQYLLEHTDEPERRTLIEVQRGTSGRPFFMAHGDLASGGFYCRDIARTLGPDQTVYALPPHDVSDVEGELSIERMASLHVAAIREVQPHGPYRLGGYCISGLIALEMAQQLQAAGEAVELLFLVDTVPITTNPRWLAPLLRTISRLTTRGEAASRERFAYLMRRARRGKLADRTRQLFDLTALPFQAVARRVGRLGGAAGTDSAKAPPDVSPLWSEYSRAMFTYEVKPYRGRIDLVWSSDLAESFGDPRLCWRGIASDLVAEQVPGSHVAVVVTHVPALVRAAILRLRDQLA